MKQKDHLYFQMPDYLDNKSYEILVNEMVSKSDAGFDYWKFKRATRSLMEMGMDETTAIKSAFATASAIGLDKEGLENTIKKNLQLLDDERKQFIAALEKQIRERVLSREEEVKKLQQIIEQCVQKIAELKTELAAHENKLSQVTAEWRDAEERISASGSKFEAVCQFLEDSMQHDLNNYMNVL
jgi:predicted  nucleic acid-binding Zn-ribbon protein